MTTTDYLRQQQAEITEHFVYSGLSKLADNEHNRITLKKIADDELKHYYIWKKITGKDVEPNKSKIRRYIRLARIFGLNFSLKLMESGEVNAQALYEEAKILLPEVGNIQSEEEQHELELISILKDNRLSYVGAIVLGLNDALVELTGTLTGLTFAFGNNHVIGITGLIMGIAAALSMASSGYLASQEDEEVKDINPIIAAVYTGFAYLITVFLLVAPYFIFSNGMVALGVMLVITLLIIGGYNYYISVAKDVSFKKRFLSMSSISIGVAAISFVIGFVVKKYFGFDL
ncbi:MAG: rubrerythrin family protein [Bacteroidetes bacterium HGW-Bacteroidetes-16]|jgi:VIT1/CCC1 family predicted Fe2+/Mn2+ transporter|nr:MAG: rubrerythrin family protein [Bacteroidetes bacterium HGW-Bacteroidetes-16]